MCLTKAIVARERGETQVCKLGESNKEFTNLALSPVQGIKRGNWEPSIWKPIACANSVEERELRKCANNLNVSALCIILLLTPQGARWQNN